MYYRINIYFEVVALLSNSTFVAVFILFVHLKISQNRVFESIVFKFNRIETFCNRITYLKIISLNNKRTDSDNKIFINYHDS